MSQVLGGLGCWISPFYGPFPLGMDFETYEPFIYLIFNFILGCGKPWILNQQIWGHTCISVSPSQCHTTNSPHSFSFIGH
jgi:hypothetical protein